MLGLIEHWRDSRVDARREGEQLFATTKNIRAVRFHVQPDHPLSSVTIDGTQFDLTAEREKVHRFTLRNNKWHVVAGETPTGEPRKSPGLQGPIDDAFMAPFLVVLPSGKSKHPLVDRWTEFELDHFLKRWRALFRGDLRTKRDVEVTAEDAKRYHLILWGDPNSNQALGRLIERLPIQWDAKRLVVNGQTYDSDSHVPMMIYPHPENTGRYIVINGQPTFRESHDRTNSLQNPKLPDWAVIDLKTPPDGVAPGGIAAADFFDESWSFVPKEQRQTR